jgi:large subunit ribosomal protein L29
MKAEKVRDLDEQEAKQQLKEIEEQLFRLQFQMSMGQMDGLKKVRQMKKDRARILTIQRERELAGEKK